MGDQWEARIGAIENIQKEFGHDIREIKERLARLTSLFKDHIKTEAVHPRAHHLCQISRSLGHSSKRRTICHVKLIAPTCDNQGLQLRLLSWQHLDLLIGQTARRENLTDKRLRRTSHAGTPSPSPTPSYFQSW